MDEVTVRDLRNHGESLIVTKDGRQVAELRPIPRPRLDAHSLLLAFKDMPAIDFEEFRADIDAVIDPSL